jgi:hypothetical protein
LSFFFALGFEMSKDSVKEAMRLQIEKLQRELWVLRASDISTYVKAQSEIHAIAKREFKASAVVIQIQSLSGSLLLSPVAINDGLGGATLEQLSRDIHASHEYRLSMNTLKPVWNWKGV